MYYNNAPCFDQLECIVTMFAWSKSWQLLPVCALCWVILPVFVGDDRQLWLSVVTESDLSL